ncbi:MAG: Uma2 family endonuclease [Campylobacterota bacterium]|nr:Uma2 family endonuclease [Campylobacterota bacterium]
MGALRKEEHLPNYTYDDYVLWADEWELIDGIAYSMAPSPMKNHQSIASNFIYEIRDGMNECLNCEVLGELDWKVDESTVLRPDIVLICNEHNDKYLTKAPLIVVEIISKSTAKRDENYKFEIYEKEKVPYYIIAYPDDLKAKIFKLKDGKYDKQADMTNELFRFTDIDCEVEINFNNIFKRFRK